MEDNPGVTGVSMLRENSREGPQEESIIVVSDVHLGGKGSHHARFCEFLRWIRGFPRGPVRAQCRVGGEAGSRELDISFSPLTKLILLGDIVDMWDPEDQDRTKVIRDSFEPLSLLHSLKCDKIYVTGNHDEDISEILPDTKGVSWGDGYLKIYPRHYPESEKISGDGNGKKVNPGLPAGGARYMFLHGHQFDGEQVPYTISKIFGERFDPVDTLTDLANMSVSRILKVPADILIAALWVFFLLVLLGPLDQALVQDSVTAILLAGVALALLRYFPKAHLVMDERKPRLWERILIEGLFLGPGIAMIAYILVLILRPGSLPSPGTLFLLPVVAILTIFTIVTVLPRLIGCVQRGVYNVFKSRDKTVEEVLNDGFVPDRDSVTADVVVFGHTHRAGFLVKKTGDGSPTGGSPLKFFVNTGCWMDTGDNRPVDTFVYIDRTGLYLLDWENPQAINCLFHLPSGSVPLFRR